MFDKEKKGKEEEKEREEKEEKEERKGENQPANLTFISFPVFLSSLFIKNQSIKVTNLKIWLNEKIFFF